MKLVEINDIRPGQIWEAHRNQFLILSRGNNIIARMYERGKPVVEGIKNADEFTDMKLCGKFGITTALTEKTWLKFPERPDFKPTMLSNSTGQIRGFMSSTARLTLE